MIRPSVPRLPALVTFAVASILSANAVFAGGNEFDDGWRRTAHGWERMDSWITANAEAPGLKYAFESEAELPPPRFEIHPLFLTLVQVFAVALAFGFFSRLAMTGIRWRPPVSR